MRVLHIVSWYPNRLDPNEGMFIKRHIQSLEPHCENRVLHLKVVKSKEYGLGLNFRKENTRISGNESSLLFFVRTTRSSLIELYTFFLLFSRLVFKRSAKGFDVINIHIAYPMGVYLGIIRKFLRQPIVFTEHWSAYHFNFYLDPATPGLERSRKIFRKGIPLICVSKALVDDIGRFSGVKVRAEVVPNVVNTSLFRNDRRAPSEPVFVMVNSWSPVKQPLSAIQAFAAFLKDHPNAQLRIGGYSRGKEMDEMKGYVKENGLEASVIFTGRLTAEQVAAELQQCTALLQPTQYETFSVICAEALCCGIPVAATATGGIPDFIDSSNGILVKENNSSQWLEAMNSLWEGKDKFNSATISQAAASRFSMASVGKKYFEALNSLTKVAS